MEDKKQLSPYQEGVAKALKEAGQAHVSEAMQQGVPAQHIEQQAGISTESQQILNELLAISKTKVPQEGTTTGLIPALLGMTQGKGFNPMAPQEKELGTDTAMQVLTKGMQNKNKDVYGFDPSTSTMEKLATVPLNTDIRNVTPKSDISNLPEELQVPAYALARKIGGVRGAEKVLPMVVNSLKSGKNIDEIEDTIRKTSQSMAVTPEWRNSVQNILGSDKSESQRNVIMDSLDDYKAAGDEEGAKDYLKRIAITSAPVDQQNKVMGKERTVEFLGEIQGDLDLLEKNGIPTNFFSGNIENLASKVGAVKSPELRKVATKIATAMMSYRRDMTGVQFGELESKEYKKLFPGINMVGAFNKATIAGLKETFSGDLNKFYEQSMGKKNHDKIFKTSSSSDSKESRYQEGQTARNKKGEVLTFRGGKWQ